FTSANERSRLVNSFFQCRVVLLAAAGQCALAALAHASVSHAPLPDPTDIVPTLHARDPNRAAIFQGAGVKLVAESKFEEALEQFRRGAALDPDNSAMLINVAFCLDKLHRYDEAITELKRARQLDPGNALVYLNWGNSLLNLHKYEESLEPL